MNVAGADHLDEGNNANDGESYFAYGDSIVAAIDPGDHSLLPGGRDSFVYYARNFINPLATADINTNGAGQGCLWATSHAAAYTPGHNAKQVFVLAFGNNDARPNRGNMTATQSADCLGDLWDAIHASRDSAVWANISPLAASCPGASYQPSAEYNVTLEAQRERAAAIQAQADARGVRLWQRYDTIDVHPHDGVLDAADPQYLYDCIHPNRAGYVELGHSLVRYLSGADS